MTDPVLKLDLIDLLYRHDSLEVTKKMMLPP